MNILISNDDGIRAEGIARLAAAALPFGRVYVAAPQSQCSGMSQKLTIRGTLAVEQADFPVPVEAAWAVGGSPADCVKAAVKALVPCRPDVVLTGVNQGWNAGLDIAYSGTIGAALEGVMNGIPAIAFSAREFCDPGAMEVYLPRVLQELLQALPKPGTLWNVNFPDCAPPARASCAAAFRPRAASMTTNMTGPKARFPSACRTRGRSSAGKAATSTPFCTAMSPSARSAVRFSEYLRQNRRNQPCMM